MVERRQKGREYADTTWVDRVELIKNDSLGKMEFKSCTLKNISLKVDLHSPANNIERSRGRSDL